MKLPNLASVLVYFSMGMIISCVGPGCSSLGVGAFSENGPFRPDGELLVRNEHSWNTGTKSRQGKDNEKVFFFFKKDRIFRI